MMSKHDFTTVSHIERIEQPTKEEFQRNFLSPRRPVIITGVINDWNALSLWTANYLTTLFSEKQVDISVSQNSIFTGDLENGFANLKQKMQFSDFINILASKDKFEKFYYLQQQSIPIEFPEILQDIKLPKYFDKKLFVDPTIWIGSGGNISPLHYDAMDNLFTQVSNHKRFLLFDPQQTSSLYPFPATSKIPHMSQINIEKPDLDKFPNFQKAKYFECIVELGEILFIPAFWWHQVYSLDNSNQELNISVNFWSKPPISQFLTPPGRRLAAQIPTLLKSAFRQ
ncbi:MAG: cupin-like domain-containing protein [Nostoc sp. DedQUE08]|uniref:cupin-like domain-containing protein n=1 Tax=Nostoc sp. DedQUE08 TaxID=3075393 RepID=UPI002AD36594|nr:cupin-like domain-containing protein [Nostoc sp. DedQUE08]MDZ8066255.1 cupin-like domain-containing protein [Nostoc sp. DedQUE08]